MKQKIAVLKPLKNVYRFLRNIIYSFPYIVSIIDNKHIKRGKLLEDRCLNYLIDNGYVVHDVDTLYTKFKNQSHKTCHIIGGGWSLNNSISLIKEEDFVIGMNYSALAEIEFDLYFIEQGLCDEHETRIKVELLQNVIKKQAKHIYFKNVYGPNGIEYVIRNYAGKVDFLKSYVIHCSHMSNLKKSMESLLEYDSQYMRQYRSTVISSIVIAKNIGFKRIFVHGLDFGGKYFYEEKPVVSGKEKYLPPKTSLSRGSKKHLTTLNSCGVDCAIVELNKLLRELDIHLFSGDENSPLASKLKTE